MRASPLALAAALALLVTPTLACAHGPRSRSGPYSLEIVDESGDTLPTFRAGGRTYVLGTLGKRYLVRVRNDSPRRVEVVVSVDGRDVIDGRPSSFAKRGYVVDPHGELVVDGYRLSHSSVAAFRFSTVPRSYASRMGDARDVGVIGVAVFPEREPTYRPYPRPSRRRGPPVDGTSELPDEETHGPSLPAPEAEARAEAPGRRSAPRPGLGTEFGEPRESHAFEVPFLRASHRPAAVLSLRYDDRAGLLSLGIDVDGRRAARADDRWLRETADPFRRDVGFAPPPPGWRR